MSYQRSSLLSAAKELGISDSALGKWRKDYEKYGNNSFPGRGNERLTDDQRRIKDLEKQLKDKELDLEILKKAVGLREIRYEFIETHRYIFSVVKMSKCLNLNSRAPLLYDNL